MYAKWTLDVGPICNNNFGVSWHRTKIKLKKVALLQNFNSVFSLSADNDDIDGYSVWGAVITEVEVDILTGEKEAYLACKHTCIK